MIRELVQGVVTLLGVVPNTKVTSWEGRLTEAREHGQVPQLPAIVVAYLGGPIQRKGGNGWVHTATFRVQCGAKSERLGPGGAAPGAADLVDVALARLAGAKATGQSWETELVPVDVEIIAVPEGRGGIWQMDLIVEATVQFEPDDEAESLEKLFLALVVDGAELPPDELAVEGA